MSNNELIENSNNDLGFRNIKIKRIENFKDYLFIVLDNDQKILTNGKNVYNLSDYEHFINIFSMSDKLCAILSKCGTQCVIVLETMETLFEDREAYSITKQDNRTLHIIKHIGYGNNTLYDIETKQYLPVPNDYEFETSLGNGLYVFREADEEHEKDFYDQKRCVINSNGKTLLSDIEGWIYYNDNHLVIARRDELRIVRVNEDTTFDIKTLKQNETIISKPEYYKGNIILVEKNAVNIYSTSLELIKNIKIDGLSEVLDISHRDNTLYLLLPLTIGERKVNRHVFVNLESGKAISHTRIEGYPYWTPTTFIGKDIVDEDEYKPQLKDFYFYDNDLNLIAKVHANNYENLGNEDDNLFLLNTITDDGIKKQWLNTQNGVIKEADYDWIHYRSTNIYGYGVYSEKGTLDFLNQEMEVVLPNFEFKKYKLQLGIGGFGFFIINDYICVNQHFTDGYGQSQLRTIILKADGEVVLDSVRDRCYPIGNSIQIVSNGQSKFLNTITGEIRTLEITAPTTDDGNIDFIKLNIINDILRIGANSTLMIEASNTQYKKVKKTLKND